MTDRTNRRKFSVDQKVAILRRHLVDRVAVSDLCDEYKIQPSVFYQWQRQVMENLGAALESGRGRSRVDGARRELEEKISALESRLAKKDQVIAEISEEYVLLKRTWGALPGRWVPHDTRDEIMDFVSRWAGRTGLPARRFIRWLGIAPGKFYSWRARYGQANEHNGKVPRDHWLAGWEKDAIVVYHAQYPLEGYRRLAFMMLDADHLGQWPTVHRSGLQEIHPLGGHDARANLTLLPAIEREDRGLAQDAEDDYDPA